MRRGRGVLEIHYFRRRVFALVRAQWLITTATLLMVTLLPGSAGRQRRRLVKLQQKREKVQGIEENWVSRQWLAMHYGSPGDQASPAGALIKEMPESGHVLQRCRKLPTSRPWLIGFHYPSIWAGSAEPRSPVLLFCQTRPQRRSLLWSRNRTSGVRILASDAAECDNISFKMLKERLINHSSPRTSVTAPGGIT